MKKYRIVHNEVADKFIVEEKGWFFWNNTFNYFVGQSLVAKYFDTLSDAKDALSNRQNNDRKDRHKVIYESDKENHTLEDIYKS